MRIYKDDIFYADLTPVVGCEQGGIRPVLIIQNDIGNFYSSTVIVAAITSLSNGGVCVYTPMEGELTAPPFSFPSLLNIN